MKNQHANIWVNHSACARGTGTSGSEIPAPVMRLPTPATHTPIIQELPLTWRHQSIDEILITVIDAYHVRDVALTEFMPDRSPGVHVPPHHAGVDTVLDSGIDGVTVTYTLARFDDEGEMQVYEHDLELIDDGA